MRRTGFLLLLAALLVSSAAVRASEQQVCVHALGNSAALGQTVGIVAAAPPPPSDWLNLFAAVAVDDQRTPGD